MQVFNPIQQQLILQEVHFKRLQSIKVYDEEA